MLRRQQILLTKVCGKFFPAYLIVEKSSFNFKYFDYNYKILNDTLESLKILRRFCRCRGPSQDFRRHQVVREFQLSCNLIDYQPTKGTSYQAGPLLLSLRLHSQLYVRFSLQFYHIDTCVLLSDICFVSSTLRLKPLAAEKTSQKRLVEMQRWKALRRWATELLLLLLLMFIA